MSINLYVTDQLVADEAAETSRKRKADNIIVAQDQHPEFYSIAAFVKASILGRNWKRAKHAAAEETQSKPLIHASGDVIAVAHALTVLMSNLKIASMRSYCPSSRAHILLP